MDNKKYCLGFFFTHILFKGKPRPKVTWTKNGEPLDPKQVSVRNSDYDSILFIRRSERNDSGKYDLQVQIENVEDKASVNIQIVGELLIQIIFSIRINAFDYK